MYIKVKGTLLFQLILFFIFSNQVYSQKINIAVLQFDAANVSNADALVLTDRLRTELINLGTFNVIERSVMEDVLKEQGFQQTGCVTTECVVEVGKLIGVDQMITGSIGRVGNMFTISARIINVETGEILNQKSLDCPCPIETLLTVSMAEIAADISGIDISKTGSVFFTSDLDSVQINIGGLLTGYTPFSLDQQRQGRYSFDAKKSGYRDYRGIYKVTPDSQTVIEITLEEMAGSLLIEAQDSDVLLAINGKPVGYAPYKNDRMAPGIYTITAKKERFREYSQTILIEDAKLKKAKVVLVPKQGQLTITPTRPNQRFNLTIGTAVYRNIRNKTLTLKEGDYDIIINEYGYHDIHKKITIKDKDQIRIRVDNKQIIVPVSFNIHPQYAFLTLDDRIIRKNKEIKLTFGEYYLEAQAEKYKNREIPFTINKNEKYTINVRLEPKSKSTTRLLSTLFPGTGQIYADNTRRGITYITLTTISFALLTSSYGEYGKQQSRLDRYREDYQNAVASDDVSRTRALYLDQVTSINSVQDQMLIYGAILGAVWLINIIDAYFFNGIPDE